MPVLTSWKPLVTTWASVGQESVAEEMGSSFSHYSLDPEHSSGGKVANPGHTGHCQLGFQIKSLLILRGFLFQGLQLSEIALFHFSAA